MHAYAGIRSARCRPPSLRTIPGRYERAIRARQQPRHSRTRRTAEKCPSSIARRTELPDCYRLNGPNFSRRSLAIGWKSCHECLEADFPANLGYSAELLMIGDDVRSAACAPWRPALVHEPQLGRDSLVGKKARQQHSPQLHRWNANARAEVLRKTIFAQTFVLR